MTNLEQIQVELTIKMGEIADICARFKYDVTPTILLRHSKGSSSSILISNDEPEAIVQCVSELAGIGVMSELSPHQAAMKQMFSTQGES